MVQLTDTPIFAIFSEVSVNSQMSVNFRTSKNGFFGQIALIIKEFFVKKSYFSVKISSSETNSNFLIITLLALEKIGINRLLKVQNDGTFPEIK